MKIFTHIEHDESCSSHCDLEPLEKKKQPKTWKEFLFEQLGVQTQL